MVSFANQLFRRLLQWFRAVEDHTRYLFQPDPVELVDRIGFERIEALYRAVQFAPRLAYVGSIIMVQQFCSLQLFDYWVGYSWLAIIIMIGEGHILLGKAYEKAKWNKKNWRLWANRFVIFCLAEGVMWGIAPIVLPTSIRPDMPFAVILVTLAVSSINISVFGSHLPAFFAIFIPSCLGSIIASSTSSDPLYIALFILLNLYLLSMCGFAVIVNSVFKRHIRLQIFAEDQSIELNRQKEIAEQASLAKSRFLAAASHDLRQPIHATGMLVGALRGIEMAPEGRQLLAKIEESTAAMDNLFVALLDVSKLDAGVVEVNKGDIALGHLIARIAREFTCEAEAAGIELVFVDTSVTVHSDPLLVERILRNFLSNALRYTQTGKILVGCRRSGSNVKLQVWDTGIGLAEDERQRIFEEYYQVGNQGRDRSKGLGLGLAIVGRLSALLGSPVFVKSKLGQGSCFGLLLPVSTNILDKIISAQMPTVDKHKFIVAIDDERMIRDAMLTLLTSWGHTVCVAASGEEAIELLSKYKNIPDLIICDYRLPTDENGFDVIKNIREEYNIKIPAFIISGDTDKSIIIKSSKNNILMMYKPLQYDQLRSAVNNLK